MSDDEEEELAQLRAQRAARAGGATTLVGDYSEADLPVEHR